MIGLGVGIDYALFLITRSGRTSAPAGPGDVDLPSDGHVGRAVLFAGVTVIIALLAVCAGRELPLWPRCRVRLAVLMRCLPR